MARTAAVASRCRSPRSPNCCDDIYSNMVNVAARIAAGAGPGRNLVTELLAEAAQQAGLPVIELGRSAWHRRGTQRRCRCCPSGFESPLRPDRPNRRMRLDVRSTAMARSGVDDRFCSARWARRFGAHPRHFDDAKRPAVQSFGERGRADADEWIRTTLIGRPPGRWLPRWPFRVKRLGAPRRLSMDRPESPRCRPRGRPPDSGPLGRPCAGSRLVLPPPHRSTRPSTAVAVTTHDSRGAHHHSCHRSRPRLLPG